MPVFEFILVISLVELAAVVLNQIKRSEILFNEERKALEKQGRTRQRFLPQETQIVLSTELHTIVEEDEERDL